MSMGRSETSRRWTIYEHDGRSWMTAEVYGGAPDPSDTEGIEVMPVAEHEDYRESVTRILNRYETALKHVEMHGAGEAVRIAREALDA